jgi:hypothetical protein
MLFFVPKKPIFTPSQIDRMANILDNAGQGFFVVLVLTPLVAGIDKVIPWCKTAKARKRKISSILFYKCFNSAFPSS